MGWGGGRGRLWLGVWAEWGLGADKGRGQVEQTQAATCLARWGTRSLSQSSPQPCSVLIAAPPPGPPPRPRRHHEGRATSPLSRRLVLSRPSFQFGKQIQAEQVPGWSAYYLDYKALKKIISSLTDNRPASEAAALAPPPSVRPGDILASPQLPATPRQASSPAHEPEGPPIYASLGQDDDRGPSFQAHKAAFFFKLERELEKVRPP